jgi:hypothetical protein
MRGLFARKSPYTKNYIYNKKIILSCNIFTHPLPSSKDAG